MPLRGISIVVVCRLAEPNTRVRFPYPAPMQRTRLGRMSLNLLVGGEIRYTTRGEGDRTVGREWLQKYMVLWGSGYPPTLSLWGHEFDSR